MKTQILLPTLGLFLASFAGAEITIASFDVEIPTSSGWSVSGGMPLTVVEDDGRKVIEFRDESDTDYVSLNYNIPNEQAFEMVSGFTFVARVRHISNGSNGGNFRVLIRIPGYGSAQLSTYRDENDTNLNLASYDSVQKLSLSVPLAAGRQSYITIKGVFRPGSTFEGPGSLEVFVDGKPTMNLGLARSTSPHAQISIGGGGGNAVVRTSLSMISDFKMTSP